MELSANDLKKLVAEGMKVKDKTQPTDVDEGIKSAIGGIKQIGTDIKQTYQVGALKSDIKDVLGKIKGSKENLEKLKARADELKLGERSTDKEAVELYNQLLAALGAVSTDKAEKAIAGVASTPMALPSAGGGEAAMPTGTLTGTTGRTRGGKGAAPAATAAPTAPEAPETAKAPETSPDEIGNIKNLIGKRKSEDIIKALEDRLSTLKVELKPDSQSSKNAEQIFNEIIKDLQSKGFDPAHTFINEDEKEEDIKLEISVSSILQKVLKGEKTSDNIAIVFALSKIFTSFGYGNEFAKPYNTKEDDPIKIVKAAVPKNPYFSDNFFKDEPEKQKLIDNLKSITGADEQQKLKLARKIVSATPEQLEQLSKDVEALKTPKAPAATDREKVFAELATNLKASGLTDEEIGKAVQIIKDNLKDISEEDEIELKESKKPRLYTMILQEAKKTVELTKLLSAAGFAEKQIKDILQAVSITLKNSFKGITISTGAAPAEAPEAPAASAEVQKSKEEALKKIESSKKSKIQKDGAVKRINDANATPEYIQSVVDAFVSNKKLPPFPNEISAIPAKDEKPEPAASPAAPAATASPTVPAAPEVAKAPEATPAAPVAKPAPAAVSSLGSEKAPSAAGAAKKPVAAEINPSELAKKYLGSEPLATKKAAEINPRGDITDKEKFSNFIKNTKNLSALANPKSTIDKIAKIKNMGEINKIGGSILTDAKTGKKFSVKEVAEFLMNTRSDDFVKSYGQFIAEKDKQTQSQVSTEPAEEEIDYEKEIKIISDLLFASHLKDARDSGRKLNRELQKITNVGTLEDLKNLYGNAISDKARYLQYLSETKQSEPMFVLKEGVFTLNKKVL